jgi:hypothetical protein
MGSNNHDTTSNITTWLKKQGYPLEMFVARHFHNAGFHVKISDFYTDFETEKPREIDITAQHHSPINEPVLLQVSFHIECKSSPDKPWILFVSDTLLGNEIGFHTENIISTETYRAFLLAMLESQDRRKFFPILNKSPLLSLKNVSYGITQAFTSGQDIPYSAIMSAVKSSIFRVRLIDSFDKISNQKYQCAVAFPVVVVDGLLYNGIMDESGEIRIQEVEKGVLYWKFPNPIHASPLVNIVTKNSLSDFVAKANETAKIFVELASDYMPRLNETAIKLDMRKRAS